MKYTPVVARSLYLPLLAVPLTFPILTVLAQGTAFTYQGRLNGSGAPLTGSYDMTFTLFNNSTDGSQVSPPSTNRGIATSNGLFTVTLDFGAGVFNGSNYWLEIGVATNGNAAFTTLTPRQFLTPTPYAVYSAGAGTAGSVWATNISGIIPLSNLSSNVALLNSNANFSGPVTIGGSNAIAPLTVPPKASSSIIGSATLNLRPNCVAVAGRYAYLVGLPLGTNQAVLQIVDVSNPLAPTLVGSGLPINGPANNAQGVAVGGHYAYVTDPRGTLDIFDVSNPSAPTAVGTLNTGGHPVPVAVAGRYAYTYVISDTGNCELHIYDVSDPSSPIRVGRALTDGRGYSGSSLSVDGRYVYVVNPVVSGSDTLQIFDVSNPSAPISVVSVSTGTNSSSQAVAISGRYAYVINARTNSMMVFDVRNPAAPALVGSTPTAAYPLSVVVAGRYAYVATLNGQSLQVFDISNPAVPAAAGSANGPGGYNYGVVSGRYGYVAQWGSGSLQVFDLGGAYLQQLEAGTIETGTLQTRDDARVGNELDVRGGLTVGSSARISGSLGLEGGITVRSNLLFISAGATNVGIGTTNPAYTLQVNGSVAGVGAYVNVSDACYKTNIQPLAHALEKVMALRGVRYDWRTTEFPEMRFDQGAQLGFVAQEIKDVLPEVVSQDSQGRYAIAYSKLVPVLVEAVKEQQKELETKNSELQELKTRLDHVEKTLSNERATSSATTQPSSPAAL